MLASMRNNLFDTFNRTNEEYSKYSTPTYNYFNETARPEFAKCREVLQKWYSKYPDRENLEFLGRFKSPINQQFRGAFFELYIHELFNTLGYSLDKTTDSCDFKIEHELKDFYLECTLSQNPLVNDLVEHQINVISDRLDELDSLYFINLSVENFSSRSPGEGKLTRWLQNRISQLDEDKDPEVRWTYDNDGWEINISLIKKNGAESKSRNMGIMSPNTGGFIDSAKPIFESLKSKRPSRYNIEDQAYIIAINSSDMSLHQDDIIKALFKHRDLEYGFFGNSESPRNTSVSGVLIIQQLSVVFPNNAKLQFWPNPWCKVPLDLPFATKVLISEKPYFNFESTKEDFEIDLL